MFNTGATEGKRSYDFIVQADRHQGHLIDEAESVLQTPAE
jgi:hypothetical protein